MTHEYGEMQVLLLWNIELENFQNSDLQYNFSRQLPQFSTQESNPELTADMIPCMSVVNIPIYVLFSQVMLLFLI